MGKYFTQLALLLFIGSLFLSCSNDASETEYVTGPESEEVLNEDDEEYNNTDGPIKKKKYDLTVLSEECLQMLDKYEEMQARMKDASNAAKANREDQELQDKYYGLLQANQKLLSDTRMVECSNDVNFQYAMSDIAEKYFN